MKQKMKIVVLNVFFLFIFFSANLFSQEYLLTDSKGNQLPKSMLNRITIEFENLTVMEALNELVKQTQIHLNYNEKRFSSAEKISLSFKDEPIIIILKRILEGTKTEMVVSKGGQIVLVDVELSKENSEKEKFTISGYITDGETGEALVAANIYVTSLRAGSISNAYGFYSLTIPGDIYSIRVSYIGYDTEEKFISLFQNTMLNIELKKKSYDLDTVIVSTRIEDEFLNSTEISSIKLTPAKLTNVPYLFGERDLLRTLHFLPGVTFGREGDSGFYVRGGDHDQNLVLLDEAPIYNAFHSFGFFSVFNSDAIKNVKLIKGAAPPKYGGRISSILDIQMNEGNLKEFKGVAGIGLIFSRLTLQGPLIEGKSSYIISGRRTYLDAFKLFSSDEALDKSKLFFYDFNLKANYIISSNDRLYLSGYMGEDGFGFDDVLNLNWGNITGTLRWNHLFSNKLFSNTSLIYSRFKHETIITPNENDPDGDNVSALSKVNDLTFKKDFQYFHNSDNTFNFGFNYVYHNYLPGHMTVKGDESFNFIVGKRDAHEFSLYGSHEYKVNEKLKIDYGLRYTLFSVEGDEDEFNVNDVEDIPYIEPNKKENTKYSRFEPRINMNYNLSDISSIKAGYSRNHQYIHMLANSNSGTPLDIWQPSSEKIKPQSADQYTIGYFRSINRDEYEFSVEAYYKKMTNLVDYRDGAHVVFRNYFESELVLGEGTAYGIELFLRKNIGNLTGWVSYTWSKSERKFDEINNGKPFPARYNRIHDFSIVANYKLSDQWALSANWVYSSGYNATIPYGKYVVENKVFTAYSKSNGYQLPAYHPLYLGVSFTNSLGGTWNFSLYNAYARKNTYMIAIRNNEINENQKEAVRYSLFSIVPSISYTLKF